MRIMHGMDKLWGIRLGPCNIERPDFPKYVTALDDKLFFLIFRGTLASHNLASGNAWDTRQRDADIYTQLGAYDCIAYKS
jgi:hypothetical protein